MLLYNISGILHIKRDAALLLFMDNVMNGYHNISV